MSTDDTQPMRPPAQPGPPEPAAQPAQPAQPGLADAPTRPVQAFRPGQGQQQPGEPQDDRPYTRAYEQSYQPSPYSQAPNDQAPYGQAPNDQAPNDQAPYGQAPYGQPPYGQPQYPPPPQGPSQGRPLRFGRTRRRRRVRRSVVLVFTVLVLAILLAIGDRVANAVAENDMASQFTSNGFPVKPSVTIEGIPFLTQLAAKDFKKVDVSATNIPAGPVTISTMHATITGMHISSFSNNATARVDHVTATAFISFGALAAAGGLGGGTGITITQAGTDTLKITAGIGGIFSDSEEARISQTGPQTITIKVLNSGSALGSLLNAFGPFSFTLPQGVPASLRITGLTLNDQGLTISAAASNATFSK